MCGCKKSKTVATSQNVVVKVVTTGETAPTPTATTSK